MALGYFHRWSKNNQHEFTPEKQEDLDKWSDMMTVNAYPDVQDGERLAQTANAVLDNYKRHQAKVLKTDSVPNQKQVGLTLSIKIAGRAGKLTAD